MNKLSGLTVRYMKTNIHRTITTIVGVTLAAILMYGIFACGYSYMDNTLYDFYKDDMGWDAMFVCDGDTAKEIITLSPYYKQNPAVADEELTLNNAWIMTKDKNTNITAVNDFNAIKEGPKLSSGVFPSGKNGIIISKTEALYDKVKLGDKIQLMNTEYYKAYSEEDQGITEEEMQAFTETKTICGIMPGYYYTSFEWHWKDYNDQKSEGNSQENGDNAEYIEDNGVMELMTEDMYDNDYICVYVTLKDHHNIKETSAKIANAFGVEKYYTNDNAIGFYNGLSNAEDDMDMTAFTAMLYLFAGIVGAFSIVMVRNAFNISVKERSNDYGILRCIGMTRRQIVKIILVEALIIGLIGTLIGCFIGHGMSVLIFKLIDGLVNTDFAVSTTMTLRFYWKSVASAALCVFVVTCYSMIAPIERLYRLNPIDALRKVESFKKSELRGKVHKSKGGLLTKLFGVEIGYAYNAAVRNKGRFISTVLTLTIATTFFITVFDTTKIMNGLFQKVADDGIVAGSFDIFYDEEAIDICRDLDRMDEVEKYEMKTDFVVFPADGEHKNSKYSNANEKEYSFNGVSENNYKKLLAKSKKNAADKKDCINVISVVWNRDESDKTKIKEVGYTGSIEGIEDDVKINVVGQLDRETGLEYLREITHGEYDDNEIIQYYAYNYFYCIGEGEQLSDAITKEGYIGGYFGTISVFLNLDKDTYKFDNYIYSTYHDYYDNLAEVKEALNGIKVFTLTAAIVGALILLMFVTNLINYQKAQMMVRREEFAILRSIGMSLKQKRKMLFAENIIAIIISFVLGNILGYICFKQIAIWLIFNEDGAINVGPLSMIISFIALAFIGMIVVFFTRDEDSFDPVNQFSIE